MDYDTQAHKISHNTPLVFTEITKNEDISKFIDFMRSSNPDLKSNTNELEALVKNETQKEEIRKIPFQLIKEFFVKCDNLGKLTEDKLSELGIDSLLKLIAIDTINAHKIGKFLADFCKLYFIGAFTFPHENTTRYTDKRTKPTDYTKEMGVVRAIPDFIEVLSDCIIHINNIIGARPKGIEWKETEIGKIPREWELTTIGDLFNVKNGKTNSQDAIERGKYPLFDRSTQLKFSNKYLFDAEAIIMPGEGKEFIPHYFYGKFDLHQRVYAITPKTNGVCLKFFYYWMYYRRDYLARIAVGSTVKSLRLNHLTGFPAPKPNLLEQQAITKILSDLDSKIELNNRMNVTLEAIAQAIFKHWFIDFEFPNEEGKPYKSSGGKMAASELGKIPEGWMTNSASNIFKLEYGWHLPEWDRKAGRVPVFGSGGLSGFHNSYFVKGPGIIIGRAGKIGKDAVYYSHVSFCPLETTFYVSVSDLKLIRYLYFLIKTLTVTNTGSSVPNLSRSSIHNYKIIIPSRTVIKNFDIAIEELFNLIENNRNEIYSLSQIRDSLLPKLMSGKIRVSIGGS
jgi:type I restriction enzyme S subunit